MNLSVIRIIKVPIDAGLGEEVAVIISRIKNASIVEWCLGLFLFWEACVFMRQRISSRFFVAPIMDRIYRFYTLLLHLMVLRGLTPHRSDFLCLKSSSG